MAVLGWLAAVVLLLIAVLHLVWTVSPWPLRSREEFARRVVGVPEDKLPGPGLTALVALLLVAAAYLVGARAGIFGAFGPPWLVPTGAGVVAGVLLVRGVAGYLASSRRETDFARLDLRIYAPLSAGLGLLCGIVAVGGGAG
ncbi:DUF3995 domain-containing protein [Actinokineospora iranica]|uniref:DUF3995 domain-containing protein n=1 Tax=Actinokineospora iranica TaxID=1271860 RepID=A0A1G6IXW7_9PSEU|nr:DUF3995 domain-containing protein [Actinokineospora iranica]SDC11260.1 Protein of unknown function [Actinokineospora iranica]